jgi:uncharacterized membrane protein
MSDDKTVGKGIRQHIGGRIAGGIAVLVPTVVTFIVLRFLLRILAGVLDPVVRRIGHIPEAGIAAASIVALLVLLYVVGVVARFFLGRRLISLGEAVVARVPLMGMIYGASKQVVETFARSDHRAFKGVVWVEFPRPGFFALGFVTGTIKARGASEDYVRLFIPTSPNPTTGFLEVVRPGEVREAGMSVEEAIKMVVSGGVLAPPHLTLEEPPAAASGREGKSAGGADGMPGRSRGPDGSGTGRTDVPARTD